MRKFNSVEGKREEALAKAKALHKRIKFYDDNPTLDDDELETMSNIFDNLIEQHEITPEELENESTGIAKKDLHDLELKPSINETDLNRLDLYMKQPKASDEMEIYRANGMDRDHDLALPFEIGYNKSTDRIDEEGLVQICKNRAFEFTPEQHPDIDPERMEDLREAYSMGMDPEDYKRAVAIGVPHDYLKEVFYKSARPHTIQTGAANGMGGIRGMEFSETAAGEAARSFREKNPGMYPESSSQGLATTPEFVPTRISVMKPVHIARAYQSGITQDELLDAWRNNGFHPLASYGTKYTQPITRYITMRDTGINHEQARGFISSLQHIQPGEVKHHLNNGLKPEEIVDMLSPYSEISAEQPEEKKAIQ